MPSGSGSAIGGASATTIAAPGEGLTAPSGDSGTSTVEGTSFATPLVTGGGRLAPADLRVAVRAAAHGRSAQSVDPAGIRTRSTIRSPGSRSDELNLPKARRPDSAELDTDPGPDARDADSGHHDVHARRPQRQRRRASTTPTASYRQRSPATRTRDDIGTDGNAPRRQSATDDDLATATTVATTQPDNLDQPASSGSHQRSSGLERPAVIVDGYDTASKRSLTGHERLGTLRPPRRPRAAVDSRLLRQDR